MMKFLFNKRSGYLAFPIFGFAFGWFLDRKETERLTLFRDKSALYGRVLREDEPPSWP